MAIASKKKHTRHSSFGSHGHQAIRRAVDLELLELRLMLAVNVSFDYPEGATLVPGTDVNLTHSNWRNEVETAIAVDPKNPARMFVTSALGERAVKDVTTETQAGLAYMISDGAGRNTTWWGDTFATAANPDERWELPRALQDSSVAFDDYGNLYLAYHTSYPNQNDPKHYLNSRVEVAKSINGGNSFTPLVDNGQPYGATNMCDDPRLVVGPGMGGQGQALWLAYMEEGPNKTSSICVVGAPITSTSFGPWSNWITYPRLQATSSVNFVSLAVGTDGRLAVAFQEDNQNSASLYVCFDPDGLGPQGWTQPRLIATSAVRDQYDIPADPVNKIYSRLDIAYDISEAHPNRLYATYTALGCLFSVFREP